MDTIPGCTLCDADGGVLVARTPLLRLIRADEAGFPAFYRVVWTAHRAEFTDLAPAERRHCMDAVALVEEALRRQLQPDKINLAALGNQVPHLHWHVIARYGWDSHFPSPVWSRPQRVAPAERVTQVAAALPALEQSLVAAFARLGPLA